jgi:light-regulated signal transduction histidine kinase (bacteriophytochrome)
MLGFCEIMLEDYQNALDSAGREYLGRIANAARKMGKLIDGLLGLSRLTRKELRKDTVDLSALASTLVADLQRVQPDRKITLVIEPGVQVRGDTTLLQVVLSNLLANAWKFTSKIPEAKIEFGRTERDGKSACYVRDNGAGFDMTYASKLFGVFQRLHSDEDFEGTGVGLATVQRVIQRHGGQIWAEGEPGKGAAFYFTL